MAICIRFTLVKVQGTKAIYRYGACHEEEDGLFEVDVAPLIAQRRPPDTPMEEIVRLLPSQNMNQSMANRSFRKIYQYYKAHHGYRKEGGYYA